MVTRYNIDLCSVLARKLDLSTSALYGRIYTHTHIYVAICTQRDLWYGLSFLPRTRHDLLSPSVFFSYATQLFIRRQRVNESNSKSEGKYLPANHRKTIWLVCFDAIWCFGLMANYYNFCERYFINFFTTDLTQSAIVSKHFLGTQMDILYAYVY